MSIHSEVERDEGEDRMLGMGGRDMTKRLRCGAVRQERDRERGEGRGSHE